MAITAMATWPASARGGRTNVVDRWVSEPRRTWGQRWPVVRYRTSYGLRVDHSPQVGAAISFLPGQAGADGFYGHVGVVEAVNGNAITISEMNAAGGPYVVSYRTLYNASQFWYVH